MLGKNDNKKKTPNKENKTIDDKKNEKENNLKNEENNGDELPQDKISKPEEFKNFDAITHFKQNIIHFARNCQEPVKDLSYYCFTCKQSLCSECGIYDHKNHLLIQRDNCLNYDNTFFNEISKLIAKGINVDVKKGQIKKEIIKSFNQIKESLSILEKEKLDEIDNIFKEIKDNYLNLKNNYLKTKESIENYYKTNKKFFNIKIKKEKQNNINISINDDNSNNNVNNDNEKKNNTDNKFELINYYNINDNDFGPNRDLENTVFLMNFELMNLCDNKNLQIFNLSNDINNKIGEMNRLIEENTQSIINYIKENFLIFDKGLTAKFDDFYWDIKLRCEKYTEHISQFQTTIYDIYKRNGCIDKLKDLLILFDSKNDKGKDILFNQQFFIKTNDLSRLNTNIAKNMSKKLYSSNGKVRSNSKNKISNKSKYNTQVTHNDKKDENKKSNKSLSKTKSNNKINISINERNINNLDIDVKYGLKKNPTNIGKNNFIPIPKKENIILNHRLIQRFYAYSILNFYSKYFKINIDDPNKIDDESNEDNIYNKKYNSIDNTSSSKSKNRNNSVKNTDRSNKKTKNNSRNKNQRNQKSNSDLEFNTNIKSAKNNKHMSASASTSNLNSELKNINSRYKTKIKSASLLSNYYERYTDLKEKAKPIINTNYIQLFEPLTNRITKIKIPLKKEEHGYTTFPDGCRHILIDSDLYITGGTDNCGYPINIVLLFNLAIGEIIRISNLNDNHSYHSIEYLENFDSIIVVGGENSSSCEIMDLDSKNWTKLPSLNFPRANSNIYYNSITSDLFVLFGMEGEMTEKTKNTDVIEVLELNDIMGGWMMVDYYKSVGLDLKNNYCITLPFLRDKLLIYGGSSARSLEKRLFALFDMIKNECIKIDSDTMDLIRSEENKIIAFDNAIKNMTS